MRFINLSFAALAVAALAVFSLLTLSKSVLADDSRVVTTIKPTHSLVAGVMGDTASPALLVDGVASPHGYALKPSQRKLLQQANIVFLIDPHFESFLAKALEDLPQHVRIASLARAGGVTVLDHRDGGGWDAHKHNAHIHEEEHDGHHDHSDEHTHASHENHNEAHSDLHLWLDPQNAIALTKAITKELGKVYPENRSTYKANAKLQIAKLQTLDSKLATLLEPIKDKPFIVFHDAYQYLERHYGLTAVGSITVEPEQKVSAKRVKEIRQKLKETNAVCVFREPQFDDKLVTTVIEGTEVKSGTLDPIGGDIEAGADLYFTMLTKLANDMRNCMQ